MAERVSRRRRPSNRELAGEFFAGRSSIGLARKYGMTSLEVQEAVRRVMWKGP